MNKYDKFLLENETKSRNKEHRKIKIMMLKFKKELIKSYPFKNIKEMLSLSGYTLFYYLIENLSTFNIKIQKYVINNIIKPLNNECLINDYIITLCNLQTKKEYDKIEIIIHSLNITGLIKNIRLDKVENRFYLTTLDDKTIKFKNILQSEEHIKILERGCHSFTEFRINQKKEKELLYATTITLNNLIGGKTYHSFILCNNFVNDYAHNIMMDFDDYKALYKPTIISCVEGNQLFRNIDNLKEKDLEFKDSKRIDLLKYAMYKQMKRKKAN